MTDAIRDNGQKKHGLYQARRLLNEWGSLAIDGRSTLGRAIARWTDAIVADLGGPDAISAQQATIIELAVRSKILLDGVDGWLLQQRSLVNKRSRKLHPVVQQRQQLSDSLARYVGMLGLERRRPPAEDLTSYLERQNYGDTDR